MVADYTDVMGLLKVFKLPNVTPLVNPSVQNMERVKMVSFDFLQREFHVCHTKPLLAIAIRPSQTETGWVEWKEDTMDPFAVTPKKKRIWNSIWDMGDMNPSPYDRFRF